MENTNNAETHNSTNEMNYRVTEREERRLEDEDWGECSSTGIHLVEKEYFHVYSRSHISTHIVANTTGADEAASSSMSRRLVGLYSSDDDSPKRDDNPDKKLKFTWNRSARGSEDFFSSLTNPYKDCTPNPYEYDHIPTTQEKRQVPLRQRLQELGIELDAPRYKNRTRSLKRRPALSTTRHPSFDSTHCCSTTEGLEPSMRSEQNLVLRSDERSSQMVHDSKSTTMPIMQQEVNLLAEDDGGCAGECTVQEVGRSTRKRRSSRILNLSLFKSNNLKSDEESSHSMEDVSQRLRRSSSTLTKQVISMFKNEKFEEIEDTPKYKCNFLMETLEKNKNQNILNAINGVDQQE